MSAAIAALFANGESLLDDKDVVQVFDLQADPLEQKDLSKDMPKEAKALLEELKAFVFKNQS